MTLASGARVLLKSWFVQSVSLLSLTELAVRILVEGSMVGILLAIGAGLSVVAVSWIAFHSFLWLVFYGGALHTQSLFGTTTEVSRLRTYMERLEERVVSAMSVNMAVFHGSGARGTMRNTSDVDLILIAGRTFREKVGTVAFLWRLRAEALAMWIPLEAICIDTAAYLALFVEGRSTRVIKKPALRNEPSGVTSRGALIALSGLDGSGKTTVAKALRSTLTRNGFTVVYFYAGRQDWYPRTRPPYLSLSSIFEGVWKRILREPKDLVGFPRLKFVFDAINLADYVVVRLKIANYLTADTIVICDRYAVDLIAFLRSLGPVYRSLEGLLLGASIPPDLSVFVDVPPNVAFDRKPEKSMRDFEKLDREYRYATKLIDCQVVDGTKPAAEVLASIKAMAVDALALAETAI